MEELNRQVSQMNFSNNPELYIKFRQKYYVMMEEYWVDAEEPDAAFVCLAIAKHDKELISQLILRGLDVNRPLDDGDSFLHQAASSGSTEILRLLVEGNADVLKKNNDDRTALEVSIIHGHRDMVKYLLDTGHYNVNLRKANGDTLLHVAAHSKSLDVVKLLVAHGFDAHAKNNQGIKPAFMSARDGFKQALAFFLTQGVSVKDTDNDGQSMLHWASKSGRLKIVRYLVSEGSNVNCTCKKGFTPLHIAAQKGLIDIVKFLLENGAVCDSRNILLLTPSNLARGKRVCDLLTWTVGLVKAVADNNSFLTKSFIDSGAFSGAKNILGDSLLHVAASKGYNEVVQILLDHTELLNIEGHDQFTPLHYAAKGSHLETVLKLLSNGAIYNGQSKLGETPLDIATDSNIKELLSLIEKLFVNIDTDALSVFEELNKVRDLGKIKAILNAQSKQKNKMLLTGFFLKVSPEFNRIQKLNNEELRSQMEAAINHSAKCQFDKALGLFRSMCQTMEKVGFGPDHQENLVLQTHLGRVHYGKGEYVKALNIYEEVWGKQKQLLGSDHEDVLHTQNLIALVLHRLDRNNEALKLFQETYEKQKILPGPNHVDTVDTYYNMALVTKVMGNREKALAMNQEIFKQRIATRHHGALGALINIARILLEKKQCDKALAMYQTIYEMKKQFYGSESPESIIGLFNIANSLLEQRKFNEALQQLEDVLIRMSKVFGPNHAHILKCSFNIAITLMHLNKFDQALKIFKEILEPSKCTFGPSHSIVEDILQRMKTLNSVIAKISSEIVQSTNDDSPSMYDLD